MLLLVIVLFLIAITIPAPRINPWLFGLWNLSLAIGAVVAAYRLGKKRDA